MEKFNFPWHEVAWREFETALASDRLSHAYLVEGPQGLGKLHLAFRMAARLLGAEWPAEDPPIPLLHPDLLWVTLEEDEDGKQRKQIGIQQIRDTCAELAMTSHGGGWKVAVVWPAEQLNPHSANALLKTLEEPPPQTLLLLVRSRLDTLPATIASRCQRIRIAPPPAPEAVHWLEERGGKADWGRLLSLAGGAPLMALLLHEEGALELDAECRGDLLGILGGGKEPVEVAAGWARRPLSVNLRWLDIWTTELVRFKAAGETPPMPAAACRALQTALERIPLHRLFRYRDEIRSATVRIDGAFNPQLVMESLLLPWADNLATIRGDAVQGFLGDR